MGLNKVAYHVTNQYLIQYKPEILYTVFVKTVKTSMNNLKHAVVVRKTNLLMKDQANICASIVLKSVKLALMNMHVIHVMKIMMFT